MLVRCHSLAVMFVAAGWLSTASAQCINFGDAAGCDSIGCGGVACEETDCVACDGVPSCWCNSPYLLGDWSGHRSDLADNGITFDADVSSFFFGNTTGGLERRFRYAGHGDYVTNVNFGKLGLQEGLFLKLRAEHRFGEPVNRDTGAILPATVLPDLPVADSEHLLLTNVLFTQMLSERFALIFGEARYARRRHERICSRTRQVAVLERWIRRQPHSLANGPLCNSGSRFCDPRRRGGADLLVSRAESNRHGLDRRL